MEHITECPICYESIKRNEGFFCLLCVNKACCVSCGENMKHCPLCRGGVETFRRLGVGAEKKQCERLAETEIKMTFEELVTLLYWERGNESDDAHGDLREIYSIIDNNDRHIGEPPMETKQAMACNIYNDSSISTGAKADYEKGVIIEYIINPDLTDGTLETPIDWEGD